MKKLRSCLSFIIIFIFCFVFCGCSSSKSFKPTKFASVGTWWWDADLDVSTYLKFADKNSVTEIYYNATCFDEKTADFIKKANKKNIDVYFLASDYNWLFEPDELYKTIDKYIEFNEKNQKNSFKGIHLDIEPHQSPDFETNRTGLITSLISLASVLNEKYPNVLFDFDIPFWLDDTITVRYTDGLKTLPAYAHMINFANKIFVMSYRDDSSEIYNLAKDELNYATSMNKTISICVETSNVGDEISFKEEGKEALYSNLNKLEESIPVGTGVAVHNIKSWKNLNK